MKNNILDEKWKAYRMLSDVKTNLLKFVALVMKDEKESADPLSGFLILEDKLVSLVKASLEIVEGMQKITDSLVSIAEKAGKADKEFLEIIEHNRKIDEKDKAALEDILRSKTVFKKA